jgi:DnaJ-class molecular chaperone
MPDPAIEPPSICLRIVVTDLPRVTCGRCAGRGEVNPGNSTTLWVQCPACKGLGDHVCAR